MIRGILERIAFAALFTLGMAGLGVAAYIITMGLFALAGVDV